MKNYYNALGVDPSAAPAEIRAAFRRAAMRWHPDRNQDRPREAELRFKEVREAYAILSKPASRAAHDISLMSAVHVPEDDFPVPSRPFVFEPAARAPHERFKPGMWLVIFIPVLVVMIVLATSIGFLQRQLKGERRHAPPGAPAPTRVARAQAPAALPPPHPMAAAAAAMPPPVAAMPSPHAGQPEDGRSDADADIRIGSSAEPVAKPAPARDSAAPTHASFPGEARPQASPVNAGKRPAPWALAALATDQAREADLPPPLDDAREPARPAMTPPLFMATAVPAPLFEAVPLHAAAPAPRQHSFAPPGQ